LRRALVVSGVPRSLLLICTLVLGGGCRHHEGLEALIGLAQIAGTAARIATDYHEPDLVAAGAIPGSELLVGRVNAATAWGEEPVAFQKVCLVAGGRIVAEASTDRAGAFNLMGHVPDGHYELRLVSDAYAGAVPVDLDLWRPRWVVIVARRSASGSAPAF
jgi:hypothetical protein